MEKILKEIVLERKKQDKKWGEQNHSPMEWMPILMEEVGEASKEALEHHFNHPALDMEGEKACDLVQGIAQKERLNNYRKEVVQIAAVAVQMIECLDRNNNV
ncbi:nucleoside triphosphate pyrophosphohydrolase family protein [Wenyingzhuangia aestuarii]|uniref:hypothetical protein n=1 Tax=Wenyingzhuangia aestuarii TaxID=1647582 RepID=UPI001ADACB78|nr:hypothetical protein [Wenyingzhuangia aestuarii]NJB83641.1 NTP pyrophosphatase (non-canonical NTP hydrolase) [Wenyingzhuangia aestuarii]